MNFGGPTSDRSSVTASPPDRDMPDEAVLAAAKDILMDVLVGNDENIVKTKRSWAELNGD